MWQKRSFNLKDGGLVKIHDTGQTVWLSYYGNDKKDVNVWRGKGRLEVGSPKTTIIPFRTSRK